MLYLSQKDKGAFLKLFNRKGYVLDFSTPSFDVFTLESVGVALCEKYQLSKGASLSSFVNEASETDVIKLLSDLFEYYEENYEEEYDPSATPSTYNYSRFKPEYRKLYLKCKKIVQRINNQQLPLITSAIDLQKEFSSSYLTDQINLMVKMQSENPTEAIGKAKELIESCCKTILEGLGVACDKKWDMSKLVGETLERLKLLPKDIPDNAPASNEMKALLGNLRAISSNIATLRNYYGNGHGKSASYKGLEERHAKLAVGSSITLVSFLWDTFQERNKR